MIDQCPIVLCFYRRETLHDEIKTKLVKLVHLYSTVLNI